MTKRLEDSRLMQIKENLLHGTFVYSHGLDLLDHIAALEAGLAEARRQPTEHELFAGFSVLSGVNFLKAAAVFQQLVASERERDQARALAEKYRRALVGLLASQDCSWEQNNGGHDWAIACQKAREALAQAEKDGK